MLAPIAAACACLIYRRYGAVRMAAKDPWLHLPCPFRGDCYQHAEPWLAWCCSEPATATAKFEQAGGCPCLGGFFEHQDPAGNCWCPSRKVLQGRIGEGPLLRAASHNDCGSPRRAEALRHGANVSPTMLMPVLIPIPCGGFAVPLKIGKVVHAATGIAGCMNDRGLACCGLWPFTLLYRVWWCFCSGNLHFFRRVLPSLPHGRIG
ncbi:hypothetical protein BT67DRAFT_290779 [Trichocladium antarcticum]|uniref:Uncharacterized protein n=1 Tax=Trichocladium antarcticum TaxID=1450529 RepID=A0AAN6UM15_9PEZI|nr:hypothetical protein BT67DRAFT_290779 [Trichocladium antarcticum]